MSDKVKIFIGASKGISFISKLIKKYQYNDPYTHVFYAYGDDLESIDLENPLLLEAVEVPILKFGGVRVGKFFSNDFKYHTEGTEIDMFYIEVTKEQKDNIESFLHSKIGLKYDYKGIFGFISKIQYMESKNKWFCSEILFEAFLK